MFYFERRRFVHHIKMVDEKLIGTNVARCSPAPSEKPFKLVLVLLGERDTGTSPGMSSGGLRTPTTRPAGRKQSPFDPHDWPHCMSGSFLFHKLLLRRAQHFLSLCWNIHLVARLLCWWIIQSGPPALVSRVRNLKKKPKQTSDSSH